MPVGEVEAGLLIPFGAPTIEVSESETLFAAAPVGTQPMPAYPPGLLERALDPRQVCVELVVGMEGQVTSAPHNTQAAECRAGPVEPEFITSAVETVRDWRFFSGQVCRFPDGVQPNDACEGEGVNIEPVPLRLTYVFVYSVVDGQAQVQQVP